MSGAHTPGPWSVTGPSAKDYLFISAGPGRSVAMVLRDSLDEEADARLIASAPALLEALRAICDEQDANEGYASPDTYDAARAAIAKATGSVL